MEERQLVNLTAREAIELVNGQVKQLTDGLMTLMGELRATKLALDTVIESHPAPQRMRELWQRVLPGLIDELHERPQSSLAEAERAGWQPALSHYSQLFDAVADRAKHSGPD